MSLAGVWLLAGGACTPEPELLAIPFDGNETSLLAYFETGTSLEVMAIDSAQRDLVPYRKFSAEQRETQLTLAYHDQPLSDLGIQPGMQKDLAEDELGGCLPAPRRILSKDLNQLSWSTESELPIELADFRFTRKTPCEDFGVARWLRVFEENDIIKGQVRVGEGQVLLFIEKAMNREVHLYLVAGEVKDLGPLLERPRYLFYAESDGRGGAFLLGGDTSGQAEIWHGRPDLGFAKVASLKVSSSSSFPRRMSGDARSGTWFTLAIDGTIGYFQQNTGDWQVIDKIEVPEDEELFIWRIGDILWKSRSEALVIRPGGRALHRLRWDGSSSQLSEEKLEVSLSDNRVKMALIESVPGLGDFIGMDSGVLLKYRDGVWKRFRDPVLADATIYAIQGLGTGLVYSGRYGRMTQYFKESEACLAEVNKVACGPQEVSLAGTHYVHFIEVFDNYMIVALRSKSATGEKPAVVSIPRPQ